MHPIVCKIGPFTVYAYGLMVVVAFLVSSVLVYKEATRQQGNAEIILNLLSICFIFGIIGARLLYIIENITYYIKNPLEIIMLQHGGLSWFGGLILGSISATIYLKKKKLPVYRTLDLLAPFVALAQAIGRIGCLLNGCCFGKVSKFGLYFEVHKLVLMPVELYASLVLLFIFIILRFLQDRPHKAGQIFFSYLLLYSLKRFSIEFWRADNEVIFWGLTLFQIISAVIFCLSFLKLLSLHKTKD